MALLKSRFSNEAQCGIHFGSGAGCNLKLPSLQNLNVNKNGRVVAAQIYCNNISVPFLQVTALKCYSIAFMLSLNKY